MEEKTDHPYWERRVPDNVETDFKKCCELATMAFGMMRGACDCELAKLCPDHAICAFALDRISDNSAHEDGKPTSWLDILDTTVPREYMMRAAAMLFATKRRQGVIDAMRFISPQNILTSNPNLVQLYHALHVVGMTKTAKSVGDMIEKAYATNPMLFGAMARIRDEGDCFPDNIPIWQAVADGTHGWATIDSAWKSEFVSKYGNFLFYRITYDTREANAFFRLTEKGNRYSERMGQLGIRFCPDGDTEIHNIPVEERAYAMGNLSRDFYFPTQILKQWTHTLGCDGLLPQWTHAWCHSRTVVCRLNPILIWLYYCLEWSTTDSIKSRFLQKKSGEMCLAAWNEISDWARKDWIDYRLLAIALGCIAKLLEIPHELADAIPPTCDPVGMLSTLIVQPKYTTGKEEMKTVLARRKAHFDDINKHISLPYTQGDVICYQYLD